MVSVGYNDGAHFLGKYCNRSYYFKKVKLGCTPKIPPKGWIFKIPEWFESESAKVGQNMLDWYLAETADLHSDQGCCEFKLVGSIATTT